MTEHQPAAAPGAERGLARWTGLACDFAGVLLLLLAALVCLEIGVRSLAGRSTLVADEYSGYLFVWITMIGVLHALRTGALLRVEHLVRRLGPRGRAGADVLAALVGMAVCAVCTHATATLLLASWRFGTVSIQPSATPIWIPQLVLPVGFALLVLLYAGALVEAGRRLHRGED